MERLKYLQITVFKLSNFVFLFSILIICLKVRRDEIFISFFLSFCLSFFQMPKIQSWRHFIKQKVDLETITKNYSPSLCKSKNFYITILFLLLSFIHSILHLNFKLFWLNLRTCIERGFKKCTFSFIKLNLTR